MLFVKKCIVRLRNDQTRAAISCNKVDLLMLRSRVFRVRNVQICVVLFSNEIHLLILRNRVFRLRNVEIWHAVQQRVRFGDAEESRIQAENRSDGKCCPARCLIADAQESLIQVAKRSNVGIAVVYPVTHAGEPAGTP